MAISVPGTMTCCEGGTFCCTGDCLGGDEMGETEGGGKRGGVEGGRGEGGLFLFLPLFFGGDLSCLAGGLCFRGFFFARFS